MSPACRIQSVALKCSANTCNVKVPCSQPGLCKKFPVTIVDICELLMAKLACSACLYDYHQQAMKLQEQCDVPGMKER